MTGPLQHRQSAGKLPGYRTGTVRWADSNFKSKLSPLSLLRFSKAGGSEPGSLEAVRQASAL